MKREKLELIYPLAVEGKYDKARVADFVSSPIIVLDGFSFFNSESKKNELRSFGKNGLIILTDSDKAGTFIRSKLKAFLPRECKIINVYSPVISGSDKRRNHTNKEHILGVESIDSDTLYDLLLPYESNIKHANYLTQSRAIKDGLCGSQNSSYLRKKMCDIFNIPSSVSANALIEYLNLNIDESTYLSVLASLMEENQN